MIKEGKASWLHRTVGLFLGAWFMIVGASGATLVFWHEIDTALHGDLILTASAVPPRPDFDAMLAVVRSAYPDRTVLGYQRFGLKAEETYPFVLGKPGDTVPRGEMEAAGDLEVFVDPATHAIVGTRPYHTFFRNLRHLHREYLVPGTGQRIEGAVGLVFFTSLVAGVVLWWRGGRKNLSRALTLRWSAPRARLLRDLHAVPAIYVVAILMFQALTGFLVADYFQLRGLLLRWFAPPPAAAPVLTSDLPAISVNEARDITLSLYPDHEVVMITLPLTEAATYAVRLYPKYLDKSRHWSQVAIGRDGRVGSRSDPNLLPQPQRLSLWMIWIHNGNFFHIPWRLVLMITGLVLATLFPTGLYIWWRKRPSRARRSDTPSSATT